MDEIYLRYYSQSRSEQEMKSLISGLSQQQNQLLSEYVKEGISVFKENIVRYICLCRNIGNFEDKMIVEESVEELFELSRIYPYLIHPIYDRVMGDVSVKEMLQKFISSWVKTVEVEDFISIVKERKEKPHYFYASLNDSHDIYL